MRLSPSPNRRGSFNVAGLVNQRSQVQSPPRHQVRRSGSRAHGTLTGDFTFGRSRVSGSLSGPTRSLSYAALCNVVRPAE